MIYDGCSSTRFGAFWRIGKEISLIRCASCGLVSLEMLDDRTTYGAKMEEMHFGEEFLNLRSHLDSKIALYRARRRIAWIQRNRLYGGHVF